MSNEKLNEVVERLLDMQNSMDAGYRKALEMGGKTDFNIEDDIRALEFAIDIINAKLLQNKAEVE